ncbi:MAG: type II/IV secretion system protein, partial [Desulfobacterales bacterium]|nr:type II/IV secretion system protein [Desulfobacterales bacterium]
MQSVSRKQFDSKSICQALISARLISADQARDALRRENQIRESLLGKDAGKTGVDKKAALMGISFIDVLIKLALKRLDQPEKEVDEDLIYKTLAASWKIPYKKIDPLKLELNLVTGTISRSFALKHLLLPLKMEEGKLVV